MANTPPPYSDITGISRTVMKDNAQESIVNYNGNARPGEMVVDLINNDVYIGNVSGALTLIATGGGSGNNAPGGPTSAVQFNAGGGLFGGTANVAVSGSGLDVAGTISSGNLIPLSDNTYFLGNSTNRWANLWLGPGTIYITDSNVASGVTAELTVLNGVLQINGSNQLQVGNLKFVNNTIESVLPGTNIQIGLVGSTANLILNRNTVIASGKSLTFSDGTIQSTAAIPLIQKGAGLGVATLDVGGQLTPAQIPSSLLGGVLYLGGWNASTNSPTLIDGTGTAGDEYSITVTGTRNLGSGSVTYEAGGFVIYNGSVWQYVPPVSNFTSLTANTHLSVNTPTGAITITTDATPDNTAAAIVSRDVNGSFGANIITATLIGTATSAGSADTATTAGTVTGNAQANITSVGTLTAVTVTGNVSGGNILAGGLISAVGNVTGAYHVGNGSTLTSLVGANVTGQVGNALVAGTVYTAAQPNITSVGTLTSLTTSGNISGGNISTGIARANSFVANAGTTAVAPIQLTSGTLLTSPASGAIEYDGHVIYATPNLTTRGMIDSKMVYYNTNIVALASNTNQQSLLGLTNGVAVTYAARYKFKIVFTARVTADNVNLFFALGGTATYFRGNYRATVGKGSYGPGMMPVTVVEVTGTTDGQVKNTINISQGGVGGHYFDTVIEGIVDTQYSGYIKPIVLFSPAPGGGSYIVANSYMEIYPISDANVSNLTTAIGNWS